MNEENKTHFNCNVKVVDMMMGAGKTSAAINHINQADKDTKFIYITPYLDEVERIKEACPEKSFKEPQVLGTKLNGLKYLITRGENIVSTHALFQRFDRELIDMCRAKNYTLIMDEVTDVIEKYDITKEDFELLIDKFVDISPENGLMSWRDENNSYYGKFSEEKRLCELGCLAYYNGSVMMWLFPIDAFDAFRNVYILTYMFSSQVQRYYYDFYHLPYSYAYICGEDIHNYCFTDDSDKKRIMNYDFKNLIHILEDNNLNMVGDRNTDLSKSWYVRNANNVAIKQLKNNLYNYFGNKRGTKSSQNLWTTFKDYKKILSGKGYSRAFVPLNMRASNKYKECVSVAYPVNRYINTGVKNFFIKNRVDVNEDGFALSEMLQFIWRSAIREGNEIWVYVPSIRMRNLLYLWIDNPDVFRTEIMSEKL